MSGMLGLVRARRIAILEKLEEEFDLLCLGRPGVHAIASAWAQGGVPMQRIPPKRAETPVTRRLVLGLGR